MNYHKKITELENMVYYKMGNHSQSVIDIIDRIEEETRENSTVEIVGALSYDVGAILEIIDPKRIHDIKILTEAKQTLSAWKKELEQVPKPKKGCNCGKK